MNGWDELIDVCGRYGDGPDSLMCRALGGTLPSCEGVTLRDGEWRGGRGYCQARERVNWAEKRTSVSDTWVVV